MKFILAIRRSILRYPVLSGVVLIFLPLLFLASLFFEAAPSIGVDSLEERVRVAEEDHVLATRIPSTTENPVRRELHQQLAVVLVGDLTKEERLAGAKRGIELLEILEEQIDAIERTAGVLADAQNSWQSDPQAFLHSTARSEVGEHVDALLGISSDIRGLSYRANHYTEQVFQRIIEDKGGLSDEHKQVLNELIPLVEEQYDMRSNLYIELEKAHQHIVALLDA